MKSLVNPVVFAVSLVSPYFRLRKKKVVFVLVSFNR